MSEAPWRGSGVTKWVWVLEREPEPLCDRRGVLAHLLPHLQNEARGAPASEGLGRMDERLMQGKLSVNVSEHYF